LILPQFGIFAQGTHSHYFLEFDIRQGVLPADVAKSFRRLRSPDVSAGGVNFVIAFGPKMWRQMAPSSAPASLTDFQEVIGSDGRKAPATQHDAWVWISGSAPDVVWDHARACLLTVTEVAEIATEQAAFTYRDSRDETGFVDGTANPELLHAPTVALVDAGQPGEGGSHVLVMRWVHNLSAFNKLSVEEQQFVIGRTKPDSVELADEEKPPTAHIARVQVDVDGKEIEIFRRSVPYGSLTEYGLCFVAFSADPSRYGRMLARMFGVGGDGLRDRLLDFSRPVSGAYYFAPSLNALSDLVGPESD
jgi:putative iron-dependent peroxidase